MTMQEIDDLRYNKRLAVAELCRRAGVSRSGYYATLSGGKAFGADTIKRLADEVRKA